MDCEFFCVLPATSVTYSELTNKLTNLSETNGGKRIRISQTNQRIYPNQSSDERETIRIIRAMNTNLTTRYLSERTIYQRGIQRRHACIKLNQTGRVKESRGTLGAFYLPSIIIRRLQRCVICDSSIRSIEGSHIRIILFA